jgi:hypothetical protein
MKNADYNIGKTGPALSIKWCGRNEKRNPQDSTSG